MPDDPGSIPESSSTATGADAPHVQGMGVEKCANCGAPLTGLYCAMCGQERDSRRRSLLAFVRNLFEEIISLDDRSMRTVVALIARPGELSLAFHQGRRGRYIPALRLYLFVSLIFFLVLSETGLAIVQLQIVATPVSIVSDDRGHSFMVAKGRKQISAPDWMAKEPGPHYSTEPRIHFFKRIGDFQSHLPASALANLDRDMKRAGRSDVPGEWGAWIKSHVVRALDAAAVNPAAVNGPLTEWIPRVLFVLLPLYAMLLAIFYWRQRKKYYFVDHLVFSLNVHSFVFTAILIAVGLAQVVSGELAAFAAVVAIGIYILLAIRRFYQQTWFWTCAKFAAISSLYAVIFLVPAIGAIVVFSVLGV